MISNRRVSVFLVFAALTTAGLCSWAPALGATENADEHGHRKIELSDLPAPSEEFRELIERGRVTFLVGGERPSTVDPSRELIQKKGRFDASTSYHLRYSYKSMCHWGWADTSRTKRLAFGVRYRQLQLAIEHQVWLREMPERDHFWDSPLVRHEMDHLRLSSDPRLNLRFVAAVKKRTRIELTGSQSAPLIESATQRFNDSRGKYRSILNCLDAEDAEVWVSSDLDEEFEKIVQLIEIRYQELDRQTNHGKRPVPAAGELSKWLASESAGRTEPAAGSE